MKLLAKIARRGPADLLLTAEALALLAIFRVGLAVVPARRIIGAITRGRVDARKDATSLDARDLAAARRVQWAVRAAARHSAIEFVCFPQTLAAYTMLRRRKVASTMVYGVARSSEGKLIAHTWLEMGDEFVVGGEAADGFAPIERWT